MSNVKIENFKWSFLSLEQQQDLGRNLLDGCFPEITSLGENPFCCEILGNFDEAQMSVVTSDSNISQHIDIYSVPFSLTYDLGEETPISKIQLASYSGFSMSSFQLYASNNREDLYNPENMLLDYQRTDNAGAIEKDWLYDVTGSLRYFGFLATGHCLKDKILRLARIALFNDFHTAHYNTIRDTSTCNLLDGVVPTVEGKIKGDIEYITNSLAYFPDKMLTLENDTTFTYKTEKEIDISDLYILGSNIKVLALTSNGKAVAFKEEREATFEGEELVKLSAEICTADLAVTLADGSVVDLIFSNTNLRRGEIDFSNVVCPDFIGIGTNLIPTFFTKMGREGGANEVYWEMQKHHMSKININCARIWFQIDWITDNKEDYYARKYTFNSDAMQSLKKYLEACRETGIEVLFNFGWKIAYNIQDWFPIGGLKDVYPYGLRQAAPSDLNQYGIALADTLEHLILDCGFDNIKYVTFYNESRLSPEDYTGDFALHGDKVGYWASMLRYAKHYVDNSKVKGMVDFWAAEQTSCWAEWMKGLNILADDCFTAHTIHRYNYSYDQMCDFYRNEIIPHSNGKSVFLTEFGNSYRFNMNWDVNHVNNVLAGANLGVGGSFNWILSGAPFLDPLNIWLTANEIDHSFYFWDFLPKSPSLNNVGEIFYELCLFNHYIPNHSKSVTTCLSNNYNDLRFSAFTKDGNYTICVENKGGNKTTDININLNTDVNKKFYKYVYRRHTDNGDGNLTVPHAEAEIEVANTLCDTLGEGYEFAVYSTIPPISQVLMSECDVRVEAGTKVELSAEVLGCEFTPTWSISASLMEGATIEGTTITVPATAKQGEMLAVKAELPTGEYGISIIRVI